MDILRIVAWTLLVLCAYGYGRSSGWLDGNNQGKHYAYKLCKDKSDFCTPLMLGLDRKE